ncbi:MAG: hypothetical protein ACJ739_06595 [Acidimicrobiales bacterium]
MALLTALRSGRSLDGLPAPATDDELLTWAVDLLAPPPIRRPRRTEPLRAARGGEGAPRS